MRIARSILLNFAVWILGAMLLGMITGQGVTAFLRHVDGVVLLGAGGVILYQLADLGRIGVAPQRRPGFNLFADSSNQRRS